MQPRRTLKANKLSDKLYKIELAFPDVKALQEELARQFCERLGCGAIRRGRLMSYLSLEFPLLVEPVGKEGYRLQPLLFPGQSAQHKRYAKAMNGFRKVVRRRFKDFRVQRHNLAELLWHRFHPEFHFELKTFQVRYGKAWIQGPIAIVFYRVEQVRYACFPKLDHRTIMLPNEDVEEVLFQAVQTFFRELHNRKEEAGATDYLSARNETTALFQTGIQITPAQFPLKTAIIIFTP